MILYFLESSALAKLFVEEHGSDRMIALVEPLTQAAKVVSTLAAMEVHSAIRRRERVGEISPASAADALSILATELSQMTEQPLNTPVVETAKQLMDRHALRSLDAVQLASCCAVRMITGISDIVFVASDGVLLAAASAEGLQTFDPAAAPAPPRASRSRSSTN